MTRNPRCDEPGSWHHIMNRGIARRTVFERREDVRYFLSRIAYAVRRRQIEIHAYCVLTTHFHLLVRSPCGQLAEAMRRIQNEYVRWFNRSRRRDGALFRGRYRSKLVTSLVYRRFLVRYIDANPLMAGLAQAPTLYPHGSAHFYANRNAPPWLERSWIEGESQRVAGTQTYDPHNYALVFGGNVSKGLADLVERRISGLCTEPDPLDDLIDAAPGVVRSWMRGKAQLADQTNPGLPLCGASDVLQAVERARARWKDWTIRPRKKLLNAWIQVSTGLLHDLAGLSSPEIGLRLKCSSSSISRMRERHRVLMQGEEYAMRIEEIAVDALREWKRR